MPNDTINNAIKRRLRVLEIQKVMKRLCMKDMEQVV